MNCFFCLLKEQSHIRIYFSQNHLRFNSLLFQKVQSLGLQRCLFCPYDQLSVLADLSITITNNIQDKIIWLDTCVYVHNWLEKNVLCVDIGHAPSSLFQGQILCGRVIIVCSRAKDWLLAAPLSLCCPSNAAPLLIKLIKKCLGMHLTD